VIRFESVTKQYPDGTRAVDELSFVAPSGQITVLVGPSGCGKTTSLRMINRMIDPSSGTIWIDDKDISTVRPTQLRRGIGYVIQQAGLFPHRTIVDNIATVPVLLGQDKKQARTRAHELMEMVGLSPQLAGRYPVQLSGGQQQRVGVARALAADPPIMLMDEPFSAVDPVVRDQLQQEFLRLQAEISKTIVFVTHDIDEAIKLGDQVAVLKVGGRLAQIATPAELLARPADSFVAGFVGRDRGYRALGFTHPGSIPVTPEPTVRLGSDIRSAIGLTPDGWVLVVDDDGAPQGWLALSGVPEESLSGPVTEELLNLGGTIATEDGTLREALDSALSSPSGRGVIVGADGHVLGTVLPSTVVALIEEQARRTRAAAAQHAQANAAQANAAQANAASASDAQHAPASGAHP
jgi:osmoprotectant transport system ATP-binding protein